MVCRGDRRPPGRCGAVVALAPRQADARAGRAGPALLPRPRLREAGPGRIADRVHPAAGGEPRLPGIDATHRLATAGDARPLGPHHHHLGRSPRRRPRCPAPGPAGAPASSSLTESAQGEGGYLSIMSNPVFEAIRTLLAVREYQEQGVPDDAIRRVVEAGRLTASARNLQPWHFVVVREPKSV